MSLTTLEMEIFLAAYFDSRKNIVVPNVSWGMFNHECDLIVLRPSGVCIEVEIKVSLSDLKADAKKSHDHSDPLISELYFAVPEALLEHTHLMVPAKAGVLLVCEDDKYGCPAFPRVKVYRKPFAINSGAKHLWTDSYRTQLLRLAAMRTWTLKRKLLNCKKGVAK